MKQHQKVVGSLGHSNPKSEEEMEWGVEGGQKEQNTAGRDAHMLSSKNL